MGGDGFQSFPHGPEQPDPHDYLPVICLFGSQYTESNMDAKPPRKFIPQITYTRSGKYKIDYVSDSLALFLSNTFNTSVTILKW